MSQPANLKLTATVAGDTWPGRRVSITVNGGHPPVALASARMQWRYRSRSGELGHEITTADSSLVIEDATAWQIRLPAQILPLKAGTWYWDLETTDAVGTVRTYLEGTHEILADVSK